MALASSNAQSDITKCFLCCKDLIDCRMLPCIHTFCLKCLQIYKKNRNVGDMLACPMCLREVKMPQGGLEHLPVNAFLQKVAEVTKQCEGPVTDVLCETCVEKFEFIATKFCAECSQNLCGTCANAHKRSKVSCNHKIVPIEERAQSKSVRQPTDAFCVRHPNEKSEMFCFDCKTVACVVCFAENHQQHKCCDISEAATQFSKDLRNVLEKLMHRLGEIEKDIKKTKSAENDLQEFITNTANVFTGKVREFKVSLDKQSNLFQQELAAIKDNCLKENEARKQESVRHRVMVDSFNKFVAELLSKGNSVDIALMFSDLQTRADELVHSTDRPHDAVQEKMKLVVVDCQRKFERIFSGVESASNRLVTDSIKISNPCVLSLLKLTKYIDTVRSQHASVQLNVETSKIIFKGPVDDVMKAKVQLYDEIYNMLEEDIIVSDLWQKLAACEDTKRYFWNLLQKQNIAAVFHVAGNRIHVCSFDPGPLKQCCDLLKSAMTEFQFDVRTSQQGIMMSQQWKIFERTLKEDLRTVEVASNDSNSAQLLIACTTNIQFLVNNRLTKFFQGEPVILEQKRTVPNTEKVLPMELGVVDIITRYLTDQFSRIQSSVTEAGGKLQPLLQKASNSGFLVVTSYAEMNEVCSKLEKLASQVKAVDLELCSTRMQKCLNSEKGEMVLIEIEDRNGVSIQKTFGAPTTHNLPVQQTFGGHMTQAQERCRKQIGNGVEVVLFQGDITRCSADVIVVSANKQLNHSPDIERSLLANGGNSIRDECQKHIYCEGCMDRKTVFVSGAGKLRCQAVFHAYCPAWTDENSGEFRRFSELIQTILSKAVKRNYRSLAMPAIHSDLSGYPIDDVTSMIIHNIYSFIEEKGMTSLVEIQLVDHDVRAVDSFETKLDFNWTSNFNDGILLSQPTIRGSDSGIWHRTPAHYKDEPESNGISVYSFPMKNWLPDQTQRKFNQFGHQRESPSQLGQWFQQQPGQLVHQQGHQHQRHGHTRQGHQQQQQQQWPQQQQNMPDAKIRGIVLKIYGLSSDSIESSVQEIQKALSI